VAVADTEQAWLDAAHGKTTRQLEQLVAGKEAGTTQRAELRRGLQGLNSCASPIGKAGRRS
jgi:hypothetical protein